MKKIVYENYLVLSPIQKLWLSNPFARAIDFDVGSKIMGNYQMWENAVITATMSLKRDLSKKRKSETFQYKKYGIDGKRYVELIMSDDEFSEYVEKLIPNFESYDEFKKLRENALRKIRNLSQKMRKMMSTSKEEYHEIIQEFELKKEDHPIRSRNVWYFFLKNMINVSLFDKINEEWVEV